MHKRYRDEIQLWLCENVFTVKELLIPVLIQKTEALKAYEVVFHDEIKSQYENLILSIVGIEVCKTLGCSVEDYYDTIEEFNLIELLETKDQSND